MVVGIEVGEDEGPSDTVPLAVTETVALGVAVFAAAAGSVGAGECEPPMRTVPPSPRHATSSTAAAARMTCGLRFGRASARLAAALARRDTFGSMRGILRLLRLLGLPVAVGA